MPEIVIVKDKAEAGRLVADYLRERLVQRPDLVLGLATGSSPLPVYENLAAQQVNAGQSSSPGIFSRLQAFALDEYVGLPPGHSQSFQSVLTEQVVRPLGLLTENVHFPDVSAEQIQQAAERYEQEIEAAGGVDIQLLGIGTNGHLGFNEPGSSLASRTRVKTLSEQTRVDNARFFENVSQVPTLCLTQGLGTISAAKHLILLAFGKQKADAIVAAVEGPITATTPGSVLQFHPHATVIVDTAAASKLANSSYYLQAWNNKPDWQTI